MIVERLLVGNLKKDLAIWRGNISLPRCESSFLISTECDAKEREKEGENALTIVSVSYRFVASMTFSRKMANVSIVYETL